MRYPNYNKGKKSRTPFNLQMPIEMREAVKAMADKYKVSEATIVRQAIAAFAEEEVQP